MVYSRNWIRVVELVRGAHERRVAVVLGGRIRNAPVRHRRWPWEVGADLAHAIAQADHMVEPLPDELLQVLGATALDVEAAFAHHLHGGRVQRLGMAAGADHLHPDAADAAGGWPRPSGTGSCCRSQEQHPDPRRTAEPGRAAAAGPGRRPGCSVAAGVGEPLAARDQIEAVVGVAPVRGAPPHGHQPAATQLAQVVRRQALPLADQRRAAHGPADRCAPAHSGAPTARGARPAAGSRAAARSGRSGRWWNPRRHNTSI